MYTPTDFLQLIDTAQIELPERVDDTLRGIFETARQTANGLRTVRVFVNPETGIQICGFIGHLVDYEVTLTGNTPEWLILQAVKAAVDHCAVHNLKTVSPTLSK